MSKILHNRKVLISSKRMKFNGKKRNINELKKLFCGEHKNMTLLKFILRKYELLAKLRLKLKQRYTKVKKFEDLRLFHKHSRNMAYCIQRKLVITCEHFLQIEADTEFEHENLKNFKKVLKKILWIEEFCHTFDAAQENQDKLKLLAYQAALYFKTDIEFWLELAERELRDKKYLIASEIVNKALEYVPCSVNLWIKLVEIAYDTENEDKVQEIIDQGMITSADYGIEIKPAEWIQAAERTKRKNIIQMVISSIIGIGDENEINSCTSYYNDYKKFCLFRKIEEHPEMKQIWVNLLFNMELEENDLNFLLKTAFKILPNDRSFPCLINAKIKWQAFEFHAAEKLISCILRNKSWHDLLTETYERFLREKKLYRETRQKEFKWLFDVDLSNEEEVEFIKQICPSAKLRGHLQDEWLYGNHQLVQKVLEKAVLVHSDSYDLWLMKGQIEIKLKKVNQAKKTFWNAIESVRIHEEVSFYIQLAKLEEKLGDFSKARNILKLGRLEHKKYSHCVELWIASIRLEYQLNEKSKAETLLNQAIKKFPYSGKLWETAMLIRPKKWTTLLTAFETCVGNESYEEENELKYLTLAAAKYFFGTGDIKKCREWLHKTIKYGPTFGDGWLYLYKLESYRGSQEIQLDVLLGCMVQCSKFELPFTEWESVKMHIDNWELTTEDLLEDSRDI